MAASSSSAAAPAAGAKRRREVDDDDTPAAARPGSMRWAQRWVLDRELEPGDEAWAVATCGDPARGADGYYAAVTAGASVTLLRATVGSTRLEEVARLRDPRFGRRADGALLDEMDIMYTVDVTIDSRTGGPVVAAAGKSGYIYVVFPLAGTVLTLEGHGNFVNHVRWWHPGALPRRNLFLLSASFDGSMRLWNAATRCQVARFLGSKAGVLSFDVHPSGALLAACGIDTHVRLWDLSAPGVQAAMDESERYDAVAQARPFRTRDELLPVYATSLLHSDYADSVHFLEPPRPAPAAGAGGAQPPPLAAGVGAAAVAHGDVVLLSKQADAFGEQEREYAGHRMLRWAPAPVRYEPGGARVLSEYGLGRACVEYFVKAAVHCVRRPVQPPTGQQQQQQQQQQKPGAASSGSKGKPFGGGGGGSSSSAAAAAAPATRVSALVAVGDSTGAVRVWQVPDIERPVAARRRRRHSTAGGALPAGLVSAGAAAGGSSVADSSSVATSTDDGDGPVGARVQRALRATSPTAAAAVAAAASSSSAAAAAGGAGSKQAAAAADDDDAQLLLPYEPEKPVARLEPPKGTPAARVGLVRGVAFSPCGRALLALMNTGRLAAFERIA